MGVQPVPNLFATTLREHGGGDIRILDELSAGRGMAAGGKRASMALVLGVALAVVLALTSLMWEGEPVASRMVEGADVVAVSAPAVMGVRQEPVPAVPVFVSPVQEVRTPAATIVEMAGPDMERPGAAIGRSGGAGGGRPVKDVEGRANARGARGATVRETAARSQSKRSDDPRAGARHAAPPVRRQPEMTRNVEDRVDADVQVIEAIVARPR
ncbi:hypothetical protein LLG90_07730 [Aromatoleum toluclasticum]|uniref:hypothetical protein n=2 Tax=Aromatoleum toluclasticum TaxID=92003 RepID=UPI0012FAF36F|nr:hypothetical protein [Aromatoleum toluclasticum]MCC4115237.1 hypothetical protein [Aromatoleum toluclasticum]